ncbi:MAG: hypothetical protein CUN56_13685, partial [Phototrophicales bacterium]
MNNNIIYLDLTYDELAFLQTRLITPPLLGMKSILPETVSEEVGMSRLQSGASSLYARGYIHDGEDGKLQIETLVLSVIATYAQARLAIQVLTATQPDAMPQRVTYYVAERLALEHIYDDNKLVHHFALTHDPGIMAELIADRMAMHDTQAPNMTPVTLKGTLFKAINEAIRAHQPARAIQLLTNAGILSAQTIVDIMNSGE